MTARVLAIPFVAKMPPPLHPLQYSRSDNICRRLPCVRRLKRTFVIRLDVTKPEQLSFDPI